MRQHAALHDPEFRKDLAAAVSEAAGLAGWLHWDMHDIGSARTHYGTAIKAARASGNATLHAYMLGNLASLTVDRGDTAEGLALLRHAGRRLGPERPATAIAWLSALEAVAHANGRNEAATWDALDRSTAAVEEVPRGDPPPWPWVFRFDHAKVAAHRLVCAVRLGRPKLATVVAGEVDESGHRKQRALLRLDLGSAYLQLRQFDEAFRLAMLAVDDGIGTQSGRVLERAREFRRGYPGEPTGVVREFDDRLRAAHL